MSDDVGGPDPVLERLGLAIDVEARRGVMPVEEHLLNSSGVLWGGCGLSAVVATGEAVLKRGCLWATVQYVSPIVHGEKLELVIEPGQHGRRMSQVSVRGMVGDRVALLALGTYGSASAKAEQFVRPPSDIPRPDDCPERVMPPWLAGMATRIEQRPVLPQRRVLDGTRGPGRSMMWMRLREPVGTSPAALSIIADLAPSAITDAMGEPTFGISLDNSIRMGRLGEVGGDGWVLLDTQVETVIRGVAQLNARIFDEDGNLLAIAGQSSRMRSAT